MNQFTSVTDPKELERKHQLVRNMGKYGGLIAYILASGIIAILYLVILIKLISSGNQLSSAASLSFDNTIIMILQRELTILTIIVAICTLARLIPFISSIMIFATSKKEGPIEKIFHTAFLTCDDCTHARIQAASGLHTVQVYDYYTEHDKTWRSPE